MKSPKSIRHKGKRVSEIIEAHQRFVRGDETGARADLSGADLKGVNLENMNLDLVNFQGANLEGARLYNARLSSVNLRKAKLRRADLRKADLTEADLSGADLTEAQVGGAELFRTDLRQAILRRANFGAANFRSAEIRGADFSGAEMRTAIRKIDIPRSDGLQSARAILRSPFLGKTKVSLQPREVFFRARRVDDEEKFLVVDSVSDQVINDPASVVEQKSVLPDADIQLVDVIRQHRIQPVARAASIDN